MGDGIPEKGWYVLTEHNGHEGETWNFYIAAEGNGRAVEALRAKIAGAEEAGLVEEGAYEIRHRRSLSRETILGLPNNTGYMDEHTVVEGVLDLGRVLAVDFADEDPLYKRGFLGLLRD